MYNMNFSLFGFKINVRTLLFVAIIVVLIGHTYCGCNNNPYALIEGFIDASSNPGCFDPSGNPNNSNGTAICDASGNKIKYEKFTTMEGFTGANINYGQSSPFDLASNTPVDTSSWGAQSMVVIPGQPVSSEVQQFYDRPEQPIPLPEGQMNLFFNTPFKPSCCPNTYSTSTGCACMTGKQYNYLIMRGGNNVPYSEY